MIHTDLRPILERAWLGGFSTKSDFAREKANGVAIAASLGLITTEIKPYKFGTKWVVTKQGLEVINECF